MLTRLPHACAFSQGLRVPACSSAPLGDPREFIVPSMPPATIPPQPHPAIEWGNQHMSDTLARAWSLQVVNFSWPVSQSFLTHSRPGLSRAGLSWLVLNLVHTQGASHWFCAGSGWGLPLTLSFNPQDNLCRQGQLPSPLCSWESWGSAGKVPWPRSTGC